MLGGKSAHCSSALLLRLLICQSTQSSHPRLAKIMFQNQYNVNLMRSLSGLGGLGGLQPMEDSLLVLIMIVQFRIIKLFKN